MFIGHFGLSFAAKKAAPKVSLATLFVATQLVDIIWPFMLVFNVEKMTVIPGYTKTSPFDFLYFPFTHSLFMGVVWGIIAALIYGAIKKDSRGAIVIGLCVLSHWFLDVVVHKADLPLSPFGSAKVGFDLWDHLAATLIVEAAIFFGGLLVYLSITKPKNKKGTWVLWSLVALLVLFTISNTFGPAPANNIPVLFVSFVTLMVILVSLAGWADKNRVVTSSPAPSGKP